MNRRLFSCLLMLVAGAAVGSPKPKVQTVAAAWRALPTTGSACGEDLTFDYGTEGGMRNFFCRALTVFSWKTFLGLAPMSPFVSGPHRAGKLNLNAKNQFGHYDPAFVRWASTALIPAADDPGLLKQTQGVYDAQMRTLARTYYRVWRVISSDRRWLSDERETYSRAIEKGDAEWSSEMMGLYEDLLGNAGNDWGGSDPNLVRSATTWWLRRTIDETAPDWVAGLERLLGTYDRTWLELERAKAPRAPPRRPATPEYR